MTISPSWPTIRFQGEHPAFRFADFVKRQQFIKDLNQFFADEKVLAVIDHSRMTSGGGTVFVQSGGSYKPARPRRSRSSPWRSSTGRASRGCSSRRKTSLSN
jgi:hypothetical protein